MSSTKPTPKPKTAASPPERTAVSERLLHALGQVREVNITDASVDLAKMIRSCGDGTVYLLVNAKSRNSPPAVLIGVDQLERLVAQMANPLPSRTLGDILDSLPFSDLDLQAPRISSLPGGGLPPIRVPS